MKNKGISKIEFSVFSDRGTVRKNNEDNMYCSVRDITNGTSADSYCTNFASKHTASPILTAVFDGMGGEMKGELASLRAAQQMVPLYDSLSSSDEISDEFLRDQLIDAKQHIEKKLLSETDCTYENSPGTTCCGILIQGNAIKPFWAGDSRLYLLRRQKLYLLTTDHTVAQEQIESGFLTPEEAPHIATWHALTMFIGDGTARIALGKKMDICAGDRLLLCTDGISDRLSSAEIAALMMRRPLSFQSTLDTEIKKGCDDNATCILIHFKQSILHRLFGFLLPA